MGKFKVGDKVRVVTSIGSFKVGHISIITDCYDSEIPYRLDGRYWVYEDSIELVEPSIESRLEDAIKRLEALEGCKKVSSCEPEYKVGDLIAYKNETKKVIVVKIFDTSYELGCYYFNGGNSVSRIVAHGKEEIIDYIKNI